MNPSNHKIFNSILSQLNIPSSNVNNISITGKDSILPSPFLIGEAGAAAMAAIGYLSSELWYLQHGRRQNINISVRDAAIAQKSHQYVRIIDGPEQELWDPISGLYQTKDNRWIQFHCNFPHHKSGVLELLGCDATKEDVIKATRNFDAEYLETTLSEKGMCAGIVRTAEEWALHPQSHAVSKLPLIEIIKISNAPAKTLSGGNRPLSGIKVLDLTRVIAGPVCGRTLAEHGADVTLVTSPNLSNIPPLVIDTGHGKKSIYLDLELDEERSKLKQLIRDVDIFSQSYRPGGLDAKGFSPMDLVAMNPNIIYVTFSTYSHMGPWAERHGYDSLVQSVSGIANEQGKGIKPEHLPAQSLDYLTGYFGCLGAMEALRRRSMDGGAYEVRVSLAKTAEWLKSLGRVKDFEKCTLPRREQISDLLTQSNSDFGKIEYMKPILQMSETNPHWEWPSRKLGSNL